MFAVGVKEIYKDMFFTDLIKKRSFFSSIKHKSSALF